MESLKEDIAIATSEHDNGAVKHSGNNSSPPPYNQRPDVVFEEYLYYAALQRRAEDQASRSPSTESSTEKRAWFNQLSDYKGPNINIDISHVKDGIVPTSEAEAERMNALRALRVTSWISVFYLITTDIIGPFNVPYAISQVGWVPGILLFFFMGLIALYTGLILWRLFVRLDSIKYPLKTYADIAERIFGKTARHIYTVLQSLQLIINVGTICLGNGQALSQITKGRLCFSICIVIWAFFGMVLGQIRTLKNFGWLANCAVWINVILICVCMGAVAHSLPNYAAARTSLGVEQGPVVTQAFGNLPLYNQVNGVMNMVYAYGGAMIFPEIMAEMSRPMDFWKGMVMAQTLIFIAYLVFGAFVYAYQGQFTLPLAFQGISKYEWQTVGNALALLGGIIVAGLYSNIGISCVVYINIVEDWLHGPPLMTPRGRILWTVMVFMYWTAAFIIGSAIPQVQTVTGLIAASGIQQFSYTFPVMLRLGYDVITDAMALDQPYAPGKETSRRVDNWNQWSRWRRGLFGGRWYFKLFNFLMSLGGLVLAFLGMWGAGEAIKATFAIAGSATSFGCKGPV